MLKMQNANSVCKYHIKLINLKLNIKLLPAAYFLVSA